MEDYFSLKEMPPKLGDLGYIRWRDISIPVAVVKHMVKDNVLCFMRRFAGISNDLCWTEIGNILDPSVWKFSKNSLNINDLLIWVCAKEPEAI